MLSEDFVFKVNLITLNEFEMKDSLKEKIIEYCLVKNRKPNNIAGCLYVLFKLNASAGSYEKYDIENFAKYHLDDPYYMELAIMLISRIEQRRADPIPPCNFPLDDSWDYKKIMCVKTAFLDLLRAPVSPVFIEKQMIPHVDKILNGDDISNSLKALYEIDAPYRLYLKYEIGKWAYLLWKNQSNEYQSIRRPALDLYCRATRVPRMSVHYTRRRHGPIFDLLRPRFIWERPISIVHRPIVNVHTPKFYFNEDDNYSPEDDNYSPEDDNYLPERLEKIQPDRNSVNIKKAPRKNLSKIWQMMQKHSSDSNTCEENGQVGNKNAETSSGEMETDRNIKRKITDQSAPCQSKKSKQF